MVFFLFLYLFGRLDSLPLFACSCIVAPKFTVKPEDVSALEGSSVMLYCAADGDPKPAIDWDKDSQMNNLNGDRFRVMPNGSLYIKEVYLSDEGKYGCTAGNSGGLIREEVQLTVTGIYVYIYMYNLYIIIHARAFSRSI